MNHFFLQVLFAVSIPVFLARTAFGQCVLFERSAITLPSAPYASGLVGLTGSNYNGCLALISSTVAQTVERRRD